MTQSVDAGLLERRVRDLLERRTDANTRFFEEHSERIARLCHRMAERFARGGRLIALGSSPAERSDVRHVAVEFVHPVIVGKRALPAFGVCGDGASLVSQVNLLAAADDIVIAFGTGDDLATGALRAAREHGCLTIAFGRAGAEWEFLPPVGDPFVAQELVETLYHVLWELVHVFFEHRGLLEGRDAGAVHDAGAASFLYPFLGEHERDLDAVLADVRGSVTMKAEEVGELRRQTLADNSAPLIAAATALRAVLDEGGKLLALGNGGSATDAMDVVADFRVPPPPWPARPAIDLCEDPAIITAIANDIGTEAIFARQVIAYGAERDALLAISTSGNSLNVIAALGEARARGLETIAMVGYDGGRVAAEGLADHVIVTRSQHIPRIQEAQASAYHVLRELVELRLVKLRVGTRLRVRIDGTVQGVGFRPYVFRLATAHELSGTVRNDERGVLIEVEGDPGAVERFLARLPAEAPPLARVESVTTEPLAPRGDVSFEIVTSTRGRAPDALVSADTATCDACLAELFDPADRRFRYPFINCTNCGPRFTIVRGVPYDRPATTMAGFEMCERCRAEYDDPRDRRFHAQPNACPDCGPVARLVDAHGAAGGGGDAVESAAGALRDGMIVAVKGIGGFHLACRADSERAVAALRARKHREDKPFAVMVASEAGAGALAVLGAQDSATLRSHARPIVIAPRRPGAAVAESVAPRSSELGVILPYSPLHHLLLADAAVPLVMTSGNVSDEPIAYRDEDAIERLGAIADLFLLHDRPIETRTDDSVRRAARVAGAPHVLMLRRSRGYVPESLALPEPAARAVLACGAELKNTFCVARGARAWVGHHVGDLEDYETLRSFREGIAHFERLFAVRPEVVAHDLHPGYLSTAYALEREGVEHVGVQHHHAHLAACLAEHGERGPAVGAIYDGTGYGPDGTVWGGELLAGDLRSFERVGHLRPVRLPGAEQAIRQPWRMACAWLQEAAGGPPPIPPSLAMSVEPARWEAIARLAATGTGSPVTTSAGRLFDAVAALCGLRTRVNYEGQAAAELEAAADPRERAAYSLPGFPVLDPRETVAAVAADLAAGVAVARVSARFHNALAGATARALARAAHEAGVTAAVLSGGVFQNALLLSRTSELLAAEGLRVLVPERLPPNDGGISYGQAVVAAGT